MSEDVGYDEYAAYYDLLFDRMSDDFAFWDRQSESAEAICELGAGTGRLTRRFAEAARVVAVEPSAQMRARLGSSTARVEVVDGTIQETRCPGHSFELVACPRGVFSHLMTARERLAAAAELRRIVRPDGRVVIDVPYYGSRYRSSRATTSTSHGQNGERRFRCRSRVEFDFSSRLVRTMLSFRVRGAAAEESSATIELATHAFTLSELEAILLAGGLVVADVFGGYDGEKFDDNSGRLIVVATPAR